MNNGTLFITWLCADQFIISEPVIYDNGTLFITWLCADQFIISEPARLFGDNELLGITTSPVESKASPL